MFYLVGLFQSDNDGIRLVARTDRPAVVEKVRQALAREIRERLRELAPPASALRAVRSEGDQDQQA